MVDALSWQYVLITTISSKFLGFEYVKEMYANDKDFSIIYHACEYCAFQKYYRYNGFLLKCGKLCVSNCSIIVHEAHSGGLMGHFGVAKTLDILYGHFYLPNMKSDVECICIQFISCRQIKNRVLLHGLYTSLPVLMTLWIDIFMNFVLELPRTRRGKDIIFIMVDWFSKIAHFITCHKTNDAINVVNIFFGMLWDSMVFLKSSLVIGMPSSLDTFGGYYGKN